jgi:hypothetical protein
VIDMRWGLVASAAGVALLGGAGFIVLASEDSSSDTGSCTSDSEVEQYSDGWSTDHVSEVFDVPGYVSFYGDESFRKRYQSCPDGSDYRQVVTFWNDVGTSHGTWQIFVG